MLPLLDFVAYCGSRYNVQDFWQVYHSKLGVKQTHNTRTPYVICIKWWISWFAIVLHEDYISSSLTVCVAKNASVVIPTVLAKVEDLQRLLPSLSSWENTKLCKGSHIFSSCLQAWPVLEYDFDLKMGNTMPLSNQFLWSALSGLPAAVTTIVNSALNKSLELVCSNFSLKFSGGMKILLLRNTLSHGSIALTKFFNSNHSTATIYIHVL